MSELKATTVYDAYWKANFVGEGAGVLVYFKSEADKVIADLEESHKMEVEQLLIEIAELKAQKAQAEDDCAYWKTMSRKCSDDNEVMAKQRAEAFKQRTEALNRERHHKYKRCLAMAKRCRDVWMLLQHFRRYPEKVIFYWRWWNIWLELAEKFKEAK